VIGARRGRRTQEGGKKLASQKLEESIPVGFRQKISGHLLLTSGTKVSPFDEKISKDEWMGQF
jgi:hypothetical protein